MMRLDYTIISEKFYINIIIIIIIYLSNNKFQKLFKLKGMVKGCGFNIFEPSLVSM